MQLLIEEDLCFTNWQQLPAVIVELKSLVLHKQNNFGFVCLAQIIKGDEFLICKVLDLLHKLSDAQPRAMLLSIRTWAVNDSYLFSKEVCLRVFHKQSQWVPFKLEKGGFPVDDAIVRVLRADGKESLAKFTYVNDSIQDHNGYWIQYILPSEIDMQELISDVIAWQPCH